jgi:SAM-dependent methyltransferase
MIAKLKGMLRPYRSALQKASVDPAGVTPAPRPMPWLPQGVELDHFPVENDPNFNYSAHQLPIPNSLLRSTVSDPDLGKFLYIGAAWASVCQHFLPEDRRASVLDMGCGVGKTARFLALNPFIEYCGFDIFMPAIEWCRREFPKVTGSRFRFEHFDGISAMYNPKGRMRSQDYVFPVPDSSVDLAIAASLFTHLFEADARHYFQQTFRALKKGGLALFSIHTFEDATLFFPNAKVDAGASTMGAEGVMLVRPDYFGEWGRASGLRVREALGRVCGQETFLFEKP